MNNKNTKITIKVIIKQIKSKRHPYDPSEFMSDSRSILPVNQMKSQDAIIEEVQNGL